MRGATIETVITHINELSDASAKSLAKMDPENLSLSEEIEDQVAQYR